MILLQLRILFRNYKNTQLYSAITILGLTVGMTATILLFIYVRYELSYDRFHEKSERIYRINSILTQETDEMIPVCIGLKDSTIQKQVPEIEELLQIKEWNSFKRELTYDNVKFKNISLIYSDPNIHKVFTIKYLRGNPDEALKSPNSVVITRSLSEKIFGTIDVIGKIIYEKYSKNPITVNGVIEDYPTTSHLKIDAICPLISIPYIYNSGCELSTYVLFHKNINLEEAVNKTMISYNTILSQHFNNSVKKTGCVLQKLTDIHLRSGFQDKGGFDADYKKLFIYMSLALLVLLTAIINFINLLTAQYEGKLRDIGIQKAVGGSRIQIVISFLIKSLIYSFISLIFAAFLVDTLFPDLAQILNRDLMSTYHNNLTLFVGLPLLAVIVGLISGIYPALLISKFSPDNLIKKRLSATRNGWFTKILVVMQFSIMIFLLVSLLVMKKQISFMKNADLGINTEGVITITSLNGNLEKSYSAIKNAMKSIPEIKSIGASTHPFGGGPSGQRIEIIGNGPKNEYPINEYRVMPGFFETLGFKFFAGRPFDEKIKTDVKAAVLNETAVKSFGLTDPFNCRILMGDTMHIIGIVKDFHFSSLEKNIEPMMFTYDNRMSYLELKLSGNDIHTVLPKVEKVIKEFDPAYLMDYIVLEDFCRDKYGSYEQMETLSTYAGIISLVLAMLGLYALTAIMVQKRTKEIAMRKINGATRIQVVRLLVSAYLPQVCVAFLIAAPIGWYVMHGWLKNFAYKTGLSWWIFLLTGLIALAIALLTVSWQSWKASTINPVESLRFE
ncbi:MAG: FtsX-like permease family protein [Methanosarcina sp.]